MQSKDSTVPSLPEERNPMFIAYPICVVTSLVLCVLWLRFRNLERILDMTLVGCTIGVGLMLGSGILSMRHAEIYINLEEVSDDQLLTHPIFLHNFILCILAILSMSIYLIHFWIVYDCWLWRKNERALENSTSSSASSSQSSSESSSQEDAQRNGQPSTSRRNDREKPRDTDPISMFEAIKNKLLNVDATNSIDEPVMLYCCCVDCWTYLKKREPGTQEYEL